MLGLGAATNGQSAIGNDLDDEIDGRRVLGKARRDDAPVEDINSWSFVFGPFSLEVPRRQVLLNGAAIALSARAFDVLVLLVRQAGSVVSKADLLAGVWGTRSADVSCLRVAMTELRKALGDGQAGARFVQTVSGRGYCFVAPVARSGVGRSYPQPTGTHHNVPMAPANLIGREKVIPETASKLLNERFVTIVGPGGVGKTSVATSVAHRLLEEFCGDVRFVDFGLIIRSLQLSATLASGLGLDEKQNDELPMNLSQRRMLVVLDCCEHVIDVVAPFATRLLREAPRVHILATSREAMLVDGEHVHRLGPLECPPQHVTVSMADLASYPATRMFMDCRASGADELELTQDSANHVKEICRKLDGNPLAIAIAAAHVESFGLGSLVELLENPRSLLWKGSRTAQSRHRTFRAALDWSYRLLSEDERKVLWLLSVFGDEFTLEAAIAVALAADVDETTTLAALFGLVNKSLLMLNSQGGRTVYTMPRTTRVYVRGLISELRDDQSQNRRGAVVV
ncbi:ATP-binding protein [Bradyrhizobium sp. STM 3557]|uniref:ATP-binding protein n=1 Tax=Bradyrhizobium sp. STM 3557 TaxID=578920 RepID=UPI0038901A33